MDVYGQTVDGYAMEMVWFWFCFGTACCAIMFVVATDTTIFCSLGQPLWTSAVYFPEMSMVAIIDIYFN